MDCSTPGFPVLHFLLEFAQTHVHWVNDTNQPSHPLSPPSPPILSLCQQQGLFQWIDFLHQVAQVLNCCHINVVDWWCAYVSVSSTRPVKILKARIVFYSLPWLQCLMECVIQMGSCQCCVEGREGERKESRKGGRKERMKGKRKTLKGNSSMTIIKRMSLHVLQSSWQYYYTS